MSIRLGRKFLSDAKSSHDVQVLKESLDGSEIYTTPVEYLYDELQKVDLILKLAVLRQRIRKDAGDNLFSGLYISEDEVDILLKNDKDAFEDSSDVRYLIKSIERQREVIKKRVALSKTEGVSLPVEHLRETFNLSLLEIDILLLCIAPYLDIRYERIYAYLQDDMTKRYPTLQLFFILFAKTLYDRALIRNCCFFHAPLVKWQILKPVGDQFESAISSLSCPLSIDERIVDFMLGSPFIYKEREGSLHLVQYEGGLDTLYVREKIRQKLDNMVRHLQCSNGMRRNIVIYLYGPHGSGKKKAASAICNSLNIPLLQVYLRDIIQDEKTFFRAITRIIRESLILESALIIEDFDLLLSDEERAISFRRHLLGEIDKYSGLAFLTGEKRWESRRGYIDLYFSVPDYHIRKKIWEDILSESEMAGDLAGRFRFTEGQIISAVSAARRQGLLHPVGVDKILEDDILTGCRTQCNQRLSEFAIQIDPRASWRHIVLPEDHISQIREICGHLKYRYVVYEEWGIDRHRSSGKGLNVLFSGPSGTGKTMTAEVIANELKLELYKIDLSKVVNKYIGETEKNLNRIFMEAEASNAILFFDEADALFGKRSDVKDAHDRYANIEVGYLLQKMEEYEGMTILATNLRQNMDEAFVRRIQFIVDFPLPDEDHRYKIWHVHFPKNAPCSNDIDFKFLARQFKLTGGNIRNIVINASFLAASDGRKICMKHLIHATRRELQKMGKLCVKGEFGRYYEMLEARTKI